MAERELRRMSRTELIEIIYALKQHEEELEQQNAALQKQMGGHTDVYAVDNHSCVINAAMEELAKPERSVERKTVKKNTPER